MIARSRAWLVERLEAAFDSTARKRGLLGRDRLEDGAGLVIAPSGAVHTFGMRFPLDIVAVDRGGLVLKMRRAVPPRRIVAAWSAFALIEIPAGTCARLGMVEGDRLIVGQVGR